MIVQLINSELLADCTWLCEEVWSQDCESADFGEKSWQGRCCPYGMSLMKEL